MSNDEFINHVPVGWKKLENVSLCASFLASRSPGRSFMAHTCHQRYTHLRIMTLTWTPSPPWLPALYMSLPLVSSPVVIVFVLVSCLCVVRGSCYVSFIHSLNLLPDSQRTRYSHNGIGLTLNSTTHMLKSRVENCQGSQTPVQTQPCVMVE